METKNIVTPNLVVYVSEIQDAILDGWKVSFEGNTVPNNFGVCYEATLYKEASTQEPPAKMTPAERMSHARAAKSK